MLMFGGLLCLWERKCLNSRLVWFGFNLVMLRVKYIVELVVELWFW